VTSAGPVKATPLTLTTPTSKTTLMLTTPTRKTPASGFNDYPSTTTRIGTIMATVSVPATLSSKVQTSNTPKSSSPVSGTTPVRSGSVSTSDPPAFSNPATIYSVPTVPATQSLSLGVKAGLGIYIPITALAFVAFGLWLLKRNKRNDTANMIGARHESEHFPDKSYDTDFPEVVVIP
jgi:hypothetical protein